MEFIEKILTDEDQRALSTKLFGKNYSDDISGDYGDIDKKRYERPAGTPFFNLKKALGMKKPETQLTLCVVCCENYTYSINSVCSECGNGFDNEVLTEKFYK